MKRPPDLTGKRGVSAQVERMASQVSSYARPEQWILFIFSQLLRVSAHTRNNLFRWIFGKITNAGDVHLFFRCRYSTWEPEEHILDQRLVQAYEEKWVLFIFIVDEKPLPVDPRGSLSQRRRGTSIFHCVNHSEVGDKMNMAHNPACARFSGPLENDRRYSIQCNQS